jgi:hypothetical protein
MTFPPPSDALEVLERMREAAITRSAADMSGVYAASQVTTAACESFSASRA